MEREKREHDAPNLEQSQQEQRKAIVDEVSEEKLHADRNTETGAPLAPSQNRTPAQEHRGGPLPNMKK